MLADVVGYLACPQCGADLAVAGTTLRCANGHAFDVARQGYVNLLPVAKGTSTGDTAAMVASRARFLASGHYAALAREVASMAARAFGDREAGCVADIGAGTGYYLARVLDETPAAVGLAVDSSKYALRRAASAHRRIGAVAADVWDRLPVRTGSVSLVLDVFSPRSAEEFRRVLRDDGALLVVTPTDRHLCELVAALGLLSVGDGKQERLDAKLGTSFTCAESVACEYPMELTRAEAADLAAMGPSAWHADPAEFVTRVGEWPEPVRVTLSTVLSLYLPA